MRFHRTIAASFSLALWLVTSVAQSAAPSDPSDATIATPGVRYESAFDGYMAYQEQPAGNWRENNDTVGQVGGHAGHLKRPASTAEPAPRSNAPAEPATPKGMADHDAHGK